MVTEKKPLLSEKTLHILRAVISVVLPLCAILLSVCFMGLRYRSNDDAMLCAIASGALGDSVHLIYSNVLLGYLVTGLNALHFANWYFYIELFCVALSLMALCHILLRRFGLAGGAAWTVLLLAAFSNNLYYFAQYTTSGFVMVSCGLLLIAEHLGEKNGGTALGIFLACMGSLFRFSCFLAAGALSAALLLYRFLLLERRKKLTAILTMLLLFALVFGALLIDKAAYRSEEWQAFTRYNEARMRYSDYASLSLGESNPFAYLGIYPADYTMLKNWNFYDPARFTPELLDTLSTEAEKFGSINYAASYLQLLESFVKPLTQHSLMLLFTLALTALYFRPRRGYLPALGTLALFLALGFVLVLQYGGRLTPWLLIGLLFSLCSYLVFLIGEYNGKAGRFPLLPLLLCGALLFAGRQDYSDYHNYTAAALASRTEEHAYFERMSEDKENLYFISALYGDDMLSFYVADPVRDEALSNVISLGGWTSAHPDRTKSLQRFGITRPIVDAVDHPNVYFDHHNIDEIAAYASQELGCTVVAVATGDNARCPYQLVRAENAAAE